MTGSRLDSFEVSCEDLVGFSVRIAEAATVEEVDSEGLGPVDLGWMRDLKKGKKRDQDEGQCQRG